MIDCGEQWRSVRKVRYMDDIEASAHYALQCKNMLFSEEVLESYLINRRKDRHILVQKHYRRGIPRTKKSMYRTRFAITLPDTLTFMKAMKILSIVDGLVKPGELAEKIEGTPLESKRRSLVLEYVLRSKYKAYECFLRHLIRLGKFVIPKGCSRRDTRFRKFLHASGFLTDVVSFYTIRDLFYELDAVNWYVNPENNLIIYSTVSLGEEDEARWNEKVRIRDFTLSLHKRIDEKSFLSELLEIYLELTGRRFTVNADLLQVRDVFCSKHSLGDYYFKKLLLDQHIAENLPYRIFLNFGAMRKRKRNYGLKIVSLPKVSSNRLALYIAIEQREL